MSSSSLIHLHIIFGWRLIIVYRCLYRFGRLSEMWILLVSSRSDAPLFGHSDLLNQAAGEVTFLLLLNLPIQSSLSLRHLAFKTVTKRAPAVCRSLIRWGKRTPLCIINSLVPTPRTLPVRRPASPLYRNISSGSVHSHLTDYIRPSECNYWGIRSFSSNFCPLFHFLTLSFKGPSLRCLTDCLSRLLVILFLNRSCTPREGLREIPLTVSSLYSFLGLSLFFVGGVVWHASGAALLNIWTCLRPAEFEYGWQGAWS